MSSQKEEIGTRQLVWLSKDLFDLTESVRKKIGMSRSGFYRYSIMHLLQQLSVLSAKLKDETR